MPPLSPTEYYLLGVVGVALVLIISDRFAPDLIALLVLLSLGLSGVVSPSEAMSGFSNPAVITIIGLFVITDGLERTGVVRRVSEKLARLSGHTETRFMVVMMAAGAILSLVVNNIAAGAVLLPAALRIARQTNTRPSKVLMPLAFGTLVGGMATLFTTANILLSAYLQQQGQRPLTMLDFVPTGGVLVVVGIAYMALVGRRLLPDRDVPSHTTTWLEPEPGSLPAAYHLNERLWEGYVLFGSPLVGTSLAESGIGDNLGITVLAIWRGSEVLAAPGPEEVIAANDMLLVLGREERVIQLDEVMVHVKPASRHVQETSLQMLPVHEIFVVPRSAIIGHTLTGLRMRSKFGLTAVAIWRGDRSYRTDVGKMPLQPGDALLLLGTVERVQALAREPGYLVPEAALVTKPASDDKRHAIWATAIAALAIGASIMGWISTPAAMLTGAVMLVLTGCIRMDEVYSAVKWRIVFLIAGMAPLSIAMQHTGLAARAGELFITAFAPFGAIGFIAGFYLLTFLVTQVLGGQVTALVIGPLAVAAATQAQVNAPAVAVAVSIACSASFLTPIAHPVNLLMMTPGGYTASDFLRVGSGMALVCFVALLIAMPLFWSL